jgi:hypothetical protein
LDYIVYAGHHGNFHVRPPGGVFPETPDDNPAIYNLQQIHTWSETEKSPFAA